MREPNSTTRNPMCQSVFTRIARWACPPKPRGRRRSRSAFTLIELLVVIAIISVLMTLVIPTLGRALGEARATVCRSNLRQLGIAIASRAGDNGGYFPNYYRDPLYPHPNPPTPTHPGPFYWGFQWDAQIAPYLGIPVWNAGYTGRHLPRRQTEFFCPVSQTPAQGGASGNWPPGWTNSYNYNTHLGRNVNGSGLMSALRQPMRTPVLTELLWLQFMSNWGLWGGANQPNSSWDPVGAFHVVAYHHNAYTNILFGDLHVAPRDPVQPGDVHSYPKNIILYNNGPEY